MKEVGKEESGLSRRSLLQMAGVGAVALGSVLPSVASATSISKALGGGGTITDVDILNFALNLEYLEAEFYSYAVYGHGIPSEDMTGVGDTGPTTGGMKVNFANPRMYNIAREIAADELHHVLFLRAALGSAAIAKPEIKLDALGFGFEGPTNFLLLARIFEDVGVSAYGGAARLITNKDILQAAARILATEAYHAGNIREMIAKPTEINKVDEKDQPPTLTNYFPTNPQGLAIIRTVGEVALLVRGPSASGGAFFPQGLNGTIK